MPTDGPIGLSRALSAMRYWERKQEVMAHNLANASSPGFKGEALFARALETAQGAAPTPESRTSWETGPITNTGNPLDVAIEGEGFFVIQTPQGLKYTRAGQFQVDEDFRLIDRHGNPVLGKNRRQVLLQPGEVQVARDGTIAVDGVPVDEFRIERPAPGSRILREDGLVFRLEGPAELIRDPRVLGGHLEESNIDPVSGMVDMIEVQRSYAAMERSVRVVDDVLDTVVNRLSKIG